MKLHILGVRHHGPGSARCVAQALQALQPDCVLIEGPPDADAVLSQAIKADIQPPVALLVYPTEQPQHARFYPFAEFSPEWVALQYALNHSIKVQWIDLPLSFVLGQTTPTQSAPNTEADTPNNRTDDVVHDNSNITEPPPLSPLCQLARAAQYNDTDLWWEHHFEQNTLLPDAFELHFAAVDTAMNALRQTFDDTPYNDLHNQQREAYMRRLLRQTANTMYQNVVVVCGAWHAPALRGYNDPKREKSDNDLLKMLPKPVETNATWLPWTYSRLSLKSGYGAGIVSPGWFEHLWRYPTDRYGHRWLGRVAQLLREKKMDTSTAHIIEAARLAEALAAMRNLSRPGLHELNEATQSVVCFGDAVLMHLIDKELVVSEKMGKVPDNLPKPPIQRNFEQIVKSLRLPISEDNRDLTLDLRNETDLLRSRFLHTLSIINITWAHNAYTRSKGTFKEAWQLRWKPELVIQLIEMGLWGNTVVDAANQYLQHLAQSTTTLKTVSELLEQAIPAALYAAIDQLKDRLDELAATGTDIQDLLASLLPLVTLVRYGDVRQTDATTLLRVVEKLISRVCIGLPIACYALDEKSALQMYQYMRTAHEAVSLLDNDPLKKQWYITLTDVADSTATNPMTAGCALRLLFDAQQLTESDTATRFARSLSLGMPADYTAAWLEGFLKNSGGLILYDNVLWHILHKWLCELPPEQFIEQLPVLRRTFGGFNPAQRRMIGEKARQTVSDSPQAVVAPIEDTFDTQRAQTVLPIVWQLLGLPKTQDIFDDN